jgi:hypothetical protein
MYIGEATFQRKHNNFDALLATASWFLVEKRALSLKKHRGVVLSEKLIAQPEDEAHQYKQ